MNVLFKPERAAHWYRRNGEPLYTVPKADGSGERNTTLADARKLDLVPSVTGVLNMIAKPGLDAWKQSQAVLSALTLPRLPDESAEDFAQRVVEDSKAQVGEAAEIGTALHAFVEGYLLNQDPVMVAGYEAVCSAIVAWIDANIDRTGAPLLVEVPVVSRLGYGGRVDLICKMKTGRLAVIDWKSQGIKADKKGRPVLNFYRTWGYQLAAYRDALEEMRIQQDRFGEPLIQDRISVILSTNKEFPIVEPKTWEGEHTSCFLAALRLWVDENSFDPSFKEASNV